MELHFSRNQKSGLMGGVKFMLDVKVGLNEAEQSFVKKYKLADTLLYEKGADKIDAATGTMSLIAARFMQMRVTVNDLVLGRTFECKDIIEIMAVQGQLKEATELFHKMLTAASTFEGEEVIRFA
nr:hypothetical protein [uncultured Roseateles sp.]